MVDRGEQRSSVAVSSGQWWLVVAVSSSGAEGGEWGRTVVASDSNDDSGRGRQC